MVFAQNMTCSLYRNSVISAEVVIPLWRVSITPFYFLLFGFSDCILQLSLTSKGIPGDCLKCGIFSRWKTEKFVFFPKDKVCSSFQRRRCKEKTIILLHQVIQEITLRQQRWCETVDKGSKSWVRKKLDEVNFLIVDIFESISTRIGISQTLVVSNASV